MPVCLIGLGSNQGDRQATLAAAAVEIGRCPSISIAAVSAWRETAPVGGPPGQSDFLNGAIRAETSLAPHDLLACLQQIEDRLGRRRDERWAARTIDLDLLLYDELVLDTPSLALPHPRMEWRRFVLEPAAEVAGDMLHPTIHWTIARLLEHLNSARPYVAVTGPIAAGKSQLARRLAEAIPARLIIEQPDWRHLKAFYANPAGQAGQMELEFLRERSRLLAADAMGKDMVVSDFWFDQSAAFARAWLTGEQLPSFFEKYHQLRRHVVRPKLIVLLDSPAEELLARVHRRGRECEQRLTEDQLARIRQMVREQANQPGLGPVLRSAGDPEVVFTEVLAAVRAME